VGEEAACGLLDPVLICELRRYNDKLRKDIYEEEGEMVLAPHRSMKLVNGKLAASGEGVSLSRGC